MSWYFKSFILYISCGGEKYMTHLLLKLCGSGKKVEKIVGFTNNYMLNTPPSNYAYIFSYSH